MEYKGIKIGEFCSDKFKTTEKVAFLSDLSIFEYDLLICDINELSTLFPKNNYDGQSKNKVMVFFDYFEKRRIDLKTYIENGKKIVFFMPYDSIYQNYSISNIHSYTSKLNLFPFPLKVEQKFGKRIKTAPNTIFTSFFEKYKQHFFYSAIAKEGSNFSLSYVENTNISVAGQINENTFFFPDVTKLEPEIEEQFLQDLVHILFPQTKTHKTELPAWTNNYLLPSEENTKERIAELTKQKEEIIAKISLEEQNHSNIINNKILITGTGDELENQIELIFKELGFEILERENNRDDLILKYNSKIIVAEIKGIKGSAAEKQAAQLNKWVANYHADFGIEPKGILIINAFKDEELTLRKFDDVFPNQMMDFVKKRQFCLITSTQLLGLYYDIKENPDKKEPLIESLFNTVGVYENYRDWKDFIKLHE